MQRRQRSALHPCFGEVRSAGYASIGDQIVVSVKEKLRRVASRRAVSPKPWSCVPKRGAPPRHSYIRFDDNAVVLLTANDEPRGTRIFR